MSRNVIRSCFPYFSLNFTEEELAERIQELHASCSNLLLENKSKESKKNDRELKLITMILDKNSNIQLRSKDLHVLIACTIKILVKYSNYMIDVQTEVSERKRKARYQLAKESYSALLEMMPVNEREEMIKTVIDVLDKENIWPVRRLCVRILTELYKTEISVTLIFHELCDKIYFAEKPEDTDVKCVIKILYDLLEFYDWPETEETVIFLERLLNLYHKSLHNDPNESNNALFANLRGSLELCIRHMIKNMSNNHRLIVIQYMSTWSINEDTTDDIVLNYGSTLEFAAYMHQADSLVNTLNCNILLLLLQMIASTVRFVSLLGNRVLQYLIDTEKNQALFNIPKIFFEDMQLNLKFSQYHKEDEDFLKQNREIIHDSLIKSFINHKNTQLNVETTYCTVCLLAIAVPCGFTAAAISCVMMNLQEMAMKQTEKVEKESAYHIHAIIISILSFICWIHQAKDFHAYIMKIVMERAQWAPHLNPPLQSRYNFAVHHVLWDKSELFLVDWEVRYGLWKRFRLNEFTRRKSRRSSIDQ